VTARPKIGIVLFQLGGPDSLEAVEPFLFNLFTDPDIIEMPLGWLLRRPLARLIVSRRKEKIRRHYQEIGGKSPILELTRLQAEALERALAPRFEARCFIAMRYWHPFTSEAIDALEAFAPEEVVLLPLYPQYSFATTGSSLNEWNRQYGSRSRSVRLIREYFDHPLYIEAVAERIAASLRQFADPRDVELVFSAHGLPQSYIDRGDPYQRQIEATVALVMQAGPAVASALGLRDAWPAHHTLCYQSKVGPQKWLEPSLDQTIHRLAAEGRKEVLVCPIAFVTEHIETLHEINIETREHATALGITRFEMVPALNDSPKFIAALADLVTRTLDATHASPLSTAARACP
jgi:ferrochelatase